MDEFKERFLKIIETNSSIDYKPSIILTCSLIETSCGIMLAISDEKELYFLDFALRKNLGLKIEKLRNKVNGCFIYGITEPIISVKYELKCYFDGNLKEFKTPICLVGSSFQKSVWQELLRIPYGQTLSYAMQANNISKFKAYRAVANANGANRILIAVPCHRIINSNGKIGGYSSGITYKKWLINHENRYQI